MKKLFLLLFLSLTLNVSATTNTNVTAVSARALTNMMRLMLDRRQFDTNVVPFSITNFAGITGGYEVTQFSTNGGILTIVPGVSLTNAVFTGITTAPHFFVSGVPTVVTNSGSGSPSATVTLSAGSTDEYGSITLNAGTAPFTNAPVVTLTSFNTFGHSTSPVLFPVNSNACAVASGLIVVSGVDTFTINTTRGMFLTNGTTYIWNYQNR